MKTFKNLFAYSAIFALLATMMPMHVNAASYDAELTEAYAYAKNKWITTMTSIDNADMYGNLTRVAMAKMVANYVLDLGLQELDTDKECNFPDVSASLDEAYDNGVTKACQLGLMGVGIEKFNPNGIVTRAEFGTVLSRALWGDEYNDATPYYKEHLNALKAEGIMTKIDNPEEKEVRGYVMIMMQRADDAYIPAVGCSAEELLACILADDYESCIAACSDENVVVLPGHATVSLVSKAAEQYVPKNAINVKVGTVKITAGENDTTVSSVEVTRFGLATIDSNEVKLVLRNNSVESRDAFVNKTTNKASVKFSPALELKARSSMTFDLVVSIEPQTPVTQATIDALNANNIHGFRVTDVVVANGVSAGTPVELGTIKTTSAESKTITVDVKNGETSLKAGENNKVIAKVNFDFDKAGWVINGFSLLQTNVSVDKTRINEIFENAKVFVDEKEVGTAVISKDKIIVSDLNIAKDRTEDVDVEIRANAIFVGDTTSMKLKLENLFAKEWDSGYGMTYGAANIVETPTLISVKGYDIKLKKVNIEKDVLESTKKALLYEATLTSATDITLKDINLNWVLSAGTFASAFDDGTLVLNIAGEEFIVDSLAYDETNIDTPVSANRDITIKVYANLKKDFEWDITFTFKSDAEDLEDNSIAAFEEKGTKVSVKKADAEVKKIAATATNKKIFSQGNGQEVGRFSIKAKQDNLKLKELKVKSLTSVKDLLNDKIDLSDVLNNPKLLVDGKEVDATISFNDATDIISFTSMDYEVKKDETVKFMLVADFDDTTLFAGGSKIQFQVLATTLLKNSRWNDVAVTAETLDEYSFGNQSPKVVVTAIEWINPKFAITITNNDIDNPLTLSTIEVNTQASKDYNVWTLCIVDSDEVSDCSDSSHLVAREVSSSAFADGFPAKKTLTFADSTGKILTDGDAVPVEQLDKNGGEVTYYVIIESGLTPEFVIFNVNKINAFNKSESVTFTPSFLNQ